MASLTDSPMAMGEGAAIKIEIGGGDAQVTRLGSFSTSNSTNMSKLHKSSSKGIDSAAISSFSRNKIRPGDSLLNKSSKLFRRIPAYFWIAFGVFAIIETLAVVGCVYYTRSVRDDNIRVATSVAISSSRALEKLVDDQKAPILSLTALVELDPHWPTFNQSFNSFAFSIYEDYPYYALEACPRGVIQTMAIPSLKLEGAELYDFKINFDMEVDLLTPGRYDWDWNIASILQNKSIILQPPWYMDGPLSSGAFVLRNSVFLHEDPENPWEMPDSVGWPSCPEDVCYTEDGRTFWGWIASIFTWNQINAGLTPVEESGLLYTLAPDWRSGNQTFYAHSNPYPSNNSLVCVSIPVFDWMQWTLCVEDENGWDPSWFAGLIVGVTALCLILSILVGLVLRSRTKSISLLAQQVESNALLAAAKEEAEEGREKIQVEKDRLGLMLSRQKELINLFDVKRNESGTLGTESAVEAIEDMRRKLSNKSNINSASGQNQNIILHELLGEGSFGRVHRGIWRGTEVAVKTMVLPAYMSGKEKREKMLIMETAISSALAHPNIVQTFTYSIDSIRDTVPKSQNGSAVILYSNLDSMAGSSQRSSMVSSTTQAKSDVSGPAKNGGAGVHGYEVRLILEYCDKGCLRDALRGAAFLGPDGMNYRAILDTALDIAKAMLHLHIADVLHGDLKARNVMLKSSGSDPRGLIAKVADFGLAVKMDAKNQTHMSNLFHGTPSHMAPELMLKGHMSKAADTYAFGVTLWELFTMDSAFQGIPPALLGHKVIHERKRPVFGMKPPAAFSQLVDDCWNHAPEKRPSFEDIMDRLMAMRSELHGPSEEMRSYEVIPDANPSQDSGDSDSSPAIQLVDISSGLGSTEYGSPSRKLKAVPALDPVDEQTESGDQTGSTEDTGYTGEMQAARAQHDY